MNSNHGSAHEILYAEMVHQGLYHIRKAGGCTGCRRDKTVPGRIIIIVVDTLDHGHCVIRHGRSFRLDLKRSCQDSLYSAGIKMSPERAPARIRLRSRIGKYSRGIHNQLNIIFLPLNLLRVSCFPENLHRHAVDGHCPVGVVEILNNPAALMTVKIIRQRTISAVPFQRAGKILEPGSNFSTDIRDNG